MSLDSYLATIPGRCTNGHDIATQHGPNGCQCGAGEWTVFTAAVLRAADDGVVHQSAVRPLIRGRIAPKHVGSMYRRAKTEGLLVDTGEREPSNDVAGRNADKLDRIYRLGAAA